MSTPRGYGLLAVAVLALPFLLSEYYVGETTWVFIYAICGISLMVLVGYTGPGLAGTRGVPRHRRLRHAFFLKHGMPWIPIGCPGRAHHNGLWACGRPAALRMTGIYLASPRWLSR